MSKNKILLGIFLSIIGLIVCEFYIYVNYSKFSNDDINISFVVSGDNLDDFENMKAGAENAALDTNCIVDFVNSPSSNGVEGEIEVINRQFSEGAEYVFIDSNYYDEIYEYVYENNLENKIFFIKSGEADNGIVPDDYQMGLDYANYIANNSDDKKIIIMYGNDSINNMNFIKGLEAAFDEEDIYYQTKRMSSDLQNLNQSAYNICRSNLYNGVIAIDDYVVDAVAKISGNINGDTSIYAVDERQEAVYYLDTEKIDALGYKDDYSMGFLSIKYILDKSTKYNVDLYYIVNRDDIYTEEYENVLFPFAK